MMLEMNWHQAFKLIEMLKEEEKHVSPINLIGTRCPPDNVERALEMLESFGLCRKVNRIRLKFWKDQSPKVWCQTMELKSMKAADMIGLAGMLSGEPAPQSFTARPTRLTDIQKKAVGS